jgi:hypothetical protein
VWASLYPSVTQPEAAEFPPLRNAALGSLAVAVLAVFLTLGPLDVPEGVDQKRGRQFDVSADSTTECSRVAHSKPQTSKPRTH